MDILVIGGTRYFGLAAVEQLLEAGHKVSIFSRGHVRPPFWKDIEHIKGDRGPKINHHRRRPHLVSRRHGIGESVRPDAAWIWIINANQTHVPMAEVHGIHIPGLSEQLFRLGCRLGNDTAQTSMVHLVTLDHTLDLGSRTPVQQVPGRDLDMTTYPVRRQPQMGMGVSYVQQQVHFFTVTSPPRMRSR